MQKDKTITAFRHCVITKIISCLLIITFTITNTTYGFDRSDIDNLRDLRKAEAGSGIEDVEAAITEAKNDFPTES